MTTIRSNTFAPGSSWEYGTTPRPADGTHIELDPVVPPIPGLRELDGVSTGREVTGMKAVPRRLLILGGGPVGTEMAQAVRRLGGEVALAEGAGHVLAREPAPLGEALGAELRPDGIELFLGVHAAAARFKALFTDSSVTSSISATSLARKPSTSRRTSTARCRGGSSCRAVTNAREIASRASYRASGPGVWSTTPSRRTSG
jgi:hypothetical protein